jgi:hypothetical protein
LPNAFRYRTSFDSSCSCRQPGESWANALKQIDDSTAERGDIVTNERRARIMSQPRIDAQDGPIKPELRTKPDITSPRPSAGAAETSKPAGAPVKPDPTRPVRAVGPTFLPAR